MELVLKTSEGSNPPRVRISPLPHYSLYNIFMNIENIENHYKFTVYQITNLINGKRYIGVHKTKNINDSYMGSGKLVKSAIKKHGIEHFNKEILVIFDNDEDMLQAEIQFVLDLNPEYNLHEGGVRGWNYVNKTG